MKNHLQTSQNKTLCILFTLGFMLAGIVGRGQTAYIPNINDNKVFVINVATNTVIDTITGFYFPWGVSVSTDGSKVYIANDAWNTARQNTISVINTTTNTITDTINVGNVGIYCNPTGICISADGSKVYVANDGNDTVSVINTLTNTVSASILVGTNPLLFGRLSAFKNQI